jgi:hypothetical protein
MTNEVRHADITHALKDVAQNMKQFDDLLKGATKTDIDMAKMLFVVGQLPQQAANFQGTMNERLVQTIRDVGNLAYLLGEAVRNLTAAVDQLGEATRNLHTPTDRVQRRLPKPEKGLFDSRH